MVYFWRVPGGVPLQPLHDLFDCTQALKKKIKCNTACYRGQTRFFDNTQSANMFSSNAYFDNAIACLQHAETFMSVYDA